MVQIDTDHFLRKRVIDDRTKLDVHEYTDELGLKDQIDKARDSEECFGGVLLTNKEGDIICKNTLDVRVDMVF
jgi:V-type H+-transporting ATPase subunit E